MENQTFNLSPEFLGGYTEVFVKIVITIIVFYGFFLILNILILNFFRDKFIKKEALSLKPHIVDLLSILNKLFYLSGFGFVIANFLRVMLNKQRGNEIMPSFTGTWDYLTFGIILIFMGVGFRLAKKAILKEGKTDT